MKYFTPDAAVEDTMMDDIDDIMPVEEKRAKKSSHGGKPGPRKVRSKTTEIIGDTVAAGVLLATADTDTRKNLTKEEAQSIGHPIVRMVGRRVPEWFKPLLPKTKLNPDDLADLEEIAATLAKWALRRMTLVFDDILARRTKKEAQQRQAVTQQSAIARPSIAVPSASLDELRMRDTPPAATPVPENGHNPMFDLLNNIDLGAVEV
jgi:hypothetical protein